MSIEKFAPSAEAGHWGDLRRQGRISFEIQVRRITRISYYYLAKTSQSFRPDLCKTALSSLQGVSPAARRLVLRKSSSEIFVSFQSDNSIKTQGLSPVYLCCVKTFAAVQKAAAIYSSMEVVK